MMLFLTACLLGGLYVLTIEPGHEPDHAASQVQSPNSESNGIELAHMAIASARQIATELAERSARLQQARDGLGLCREISAQLDEMNPQETTENNGIIQGKVEKGATLADVLENAGTGSIRNYVNAAARVFPLRSFRAGQPYTVVTDPVTGRISRFEYEVDDKNRLVVEGDEHPRARMEEIKYVTLLETCEGVIDDSLFRAVADIGENPQLALRLVDLFGSEINFLRNIQPGDTFSVLIEKHFREGEYHGYGRILAARFTNRGKTYEAWLFRDGSGNLNYYNSRGENLKKALLMSPLAVTRLTSQFTHSRRHPILGGMRPHLGVDYAAPIGTPVKAVGEGVVTRRGWSGGYGNQIILQHESGLESMYAHLSGFARGLSVGQKVRQGQVIGFVGSTGMSTGPHLDFRLRLNGEFINPTKAINPRYNPVSGSLMAEFKKVMHREKAYLEGAKLPEKYALNSIVPDKVIDREALAAEQRITKWDRMRRRPFFDRPGPMSRMERMRRIAQIERASKLANVYKHRRAMSREAANQSDASVRKMAQKQSKKRRKP